MRVNHNIPAFMLSILLLGACKKHVDFGPLSDIRPDVPVTVANVFDYRPAPVVKASKAENKITITLKIPEGSGRSIKEITKIAAVATSTTPNYTVIQNSNAVSASGLYTNTPIAGTGSTVTFTTTFDEFKLKTGVTAVPASNTLLARDFYFLLTLDNSQTIVTQNVRVWVVD